MVEVSVTSLLEDGKNFYTNTIIEESLSLFGEGDKMLPSWHYRSP